MLKMASSKTKTGRCQTSYSNRDNSEEGDLHDVNVMVGNISYYTVQKSIF